MLFSKDDTTGQITAALLKDGNTGAWECIFISCPNPVCTCRSIEIVLAPLNDETHPDQPSYERRVNIDLAQKMVGTASQNDMTPEDLEFSNLFQSQLNDADFEFMFGEHFDYKNEIH